MAEFKFLYNASPTCARFIESTAARKIIHGPVGAGKTSACIVALLLNAMQQEPDNDGIRRTRHLIIRNTVPMLRGTTIKSFLDWLPDGVFGRWAVSDKIYYMKFEDIEAEFTFLSLEDENDLRKLLSLETTTCYFNEFREINQAVIEGMIGTKRVGRYPSRKQGPGATNPCILADTNSPSQDTFHQQIMDGDIPGWETFKQPGGRSPEAENLEFLPPDYYATEGLTDEYIRTMIDCEYGTSREGMPVFRSTFIPDFHVSGEPLKPIISAAHPLIIGLDAGLTPAATIGQHTPSGKINILAECFTPKGESIGMERFLDSRLIPLLKNRFPENQVLVVIDPAAMQRSQATEETVFQIVEKRGLKVIPAPTNKTDLRIGSAESLFGQQVEGKALLRIDEGCQGLIKALKYGYKYATRKDGEVEDKPFKDHPSSDICDSFTYLTVYLTGIRGSQTREKREIKTVAMAGWT